MQSIKTITLCLVLSFFAINTFAQNLQGSWTRTGAFGDKEITYVMLFSGDFFSWTAYYTADGDFIATKGGSFDFKEDKVNFFYEFDTADSSMVGHSETHTIKLKGKSLSMDNGRTKWKCIDAGKSTPLNSAWLMSGRKRNGEISKRDTDRPRKTMKILTPSRFQWIAYNTATKQFMGTGGGSYTAVDGKYTENIEFFSRDKTRVGASLGFNFEMQDGDWHHSGKSSKGAPMYEIWSKRQMK